MAAPCKAVSLKIGFADTQRTWIRTHTDWDHRWPSEVANEHPSCEVSETCLRLSSIVGIRRRVGKGSLGSDNRGPRKSQMRACIHDAGPLTSGQGCRS